MLWGSALSEYLVCVLLYVADRRGFAIVNAMSLRQGVAGFDQAPRFANVNALRHAINSDNL
jgi:hypothetical protein